MKVSIVVICHNSLTNVKQLLTSVKMAMLGIDHEIIVADNGSTDGTDEFLQTCDVTYILLDRNYGVAYARNRAIEKANAEYIWILDDDTMINAEAATAMVSYLDEHPECGVCSCALVDEDGSLQLSYKPYPGLWAKIRNVLHIHTSDRYARQIKLQVPFQPEYVIGACQMVRRKVFDEVGLLDEHIFYGPEDADFCLRARHAGWQVVYIPMVSIIHKWRRITSRRPFSAIGRLHIKGLIYLYWKHRRLW